MALIPVTTTPITITAADTNVNELDFSVCNNFKLHPGAQGAVDVKLKVTVGTIQFAVDDDPVAANPAHAVDDVLSIRLWNGNVLKFKAGLATHAFVITI